MCPQVLDINTLSFRYETQLDFHAFQIVCKCFVSHSCQLEYVSNWSPVLSYLLQIFEMKNASGTDVLYMRNKEGIYEKLLCGFDNNGNDYFAVFPHPHIARCLLINEIINPFS